MHRRGMSVLVNAKQQTAGEQNLFSAAPGDHVLRCCRDSGRASRSYNSRRRTTHWCRRGGNLPRSAVAATITPAYCLSSC